MSRSQADPSVFSPRRQEQINVVECCHRILRWLTCAIVFLLLTGSANFAEAAAPTVDQVKVAYLYQFTKYIKWPDAEKKKEFVIGVLGSHSLHQELDNLAAKKKASGRPIVIRRFQSWLEYQPCQILIVTGPANSEHSQQALAGTQGQSVLVVGDSPGHAEQGTVISFSKIDRRIGLKLNLQSAKSRGLKVDGKLLKVSQVVKQ